MKILHVLLAVTVESLGERSERKRDLKYEAIKLEVLVEEANYLDTRKWSVATSYSTTDLLFSGSKS